MIVAHAGNGHGRHPLDGPGDDPHLPDAHAVSGMVL